MDLIPTAARNWILPTRRMILVTDSPQSFQMRTQSSWHLDYSLVILSREPSLTTQDFWRIQFWDNKWALWASLVAQWLRIRLPIQGTWVRALDREDPTCRRATKPMCHNYWVCALEPTSHNYWAHMPQLLKPVHLEPVLCNKRSHRNEKTEHHNEE